MNTKSHENGPSFEDMSGHDLLSTYNAMVREALTTGLTGYREIRIFHDKPTAVRRCEALAASLRARADGLGAVEQENHMQGPSDPLQGRPSYLGEGVSPGRARLLADPRAEEARQRTLADQEEALKESTMVKRTKKRTSTKNGNGEHKWATQHKIIAKLLNSKKGCTREEVLAATGWATCSVAIQARMIGIALRKEKTEEGLRYYAA